MAGLRFGVYMVGIIVAIVGLWLLLRAPGITGSLGNDVILGVIVILLGLGIMAASARIWEPASWGWGPRRRRYVERTEKAPVYREPVTRESAPGESRETVVEEE